MCNSTDYEVLEDGTIIGKWGRELKTFKNNSGYLSFRCYSAGTYGTLAVHRLVAEKFIPNPENKCCVNHKDGDKTNNHVSNLEWVTRSENMQHAVDTGLRGYDTQARGEEHGNAKLSCEILKRIREAVKNGANRASQARLYGVHRNVLYRALDGKTWKHCNEGD